MKNIIHKNIIIILGLAIIFICCHNSGQAENTLASRLKGRILLQVEKNGEAWYVNPFLNERFYLGRPLDAFSLMKKFGIGITNTDIQKIQVAEANLGGPDSDLDGLSDAFENSINTDTNNPDSDNDGYGDKAEILNGYNPLGEGRMQIDIEFAKSQAGNILIQAEQNGEAWYVNPADNLRYFLGRPEDAFNIMRELGLGITNNNLAKIPEFQPNTDVLNEKIVAENTEPIKNNTGRKYTDKNNNYIFNYPASWQILKSPANENVIYLGDYQEDLFEEKKGLLIIIYHKSETPLDILGFGVAEKEGAKKDFTGTSTVASRIALQEGFSYAGVGSYEITTTIQVDPATFLSVILISAGTKAQYDKIYYDLLESIEILE